MRFTVVVSLPASCIYLFNSVFDNRYLNSLLIKPVSHSSTCKSVGGADSIMGHGGYVHGSHAVDECLDEDVLDSDEAAAAVMRSAAATLNGKSPDLIPVRKGRVLRAVRERLSHQKWHFTLQLHDGV